MRPPNAREAVPERRGQHRLAAAAGADQREPRGPRAHNRARERRARRYGPSTLAVAAEKSCGAWLNRVSVCAQRTVKWARELHSVAMIFDVSAELDYKVQFPSAMVLSVHAQHNASQSVLEEEFAVEPRLPVSEYADDLGNRFIGLETGNHPQLAIRYREGGLRSRAAARFAIAADPGRGDREPRDPVPVPEPLLPVRPARRLAWDLFGKIENPHDKVIAITDWIHENVEYLRGTTDSEHVGLRHGHTARRRVPRLRPSRDRAVPRAQHSGALLHRLRLRARATGLPRLLRVLHRRRMDDLRRDAARPSERSRAHRDGPRRGRHRSCEHLRLRALHEHEGRAARSATARRSCQSRGAQLERRGVSLPTALSRRCCACTSSTGTTYPIPTPVEFGRHRLVLRPREGHDLRIVEMALEIAPAHEITWVRDVYGNSLALVDFTANPPQLEIVSDVTVERSEPFPERRSTSRGSCRGRCSMPIEEQAVIDAYRRLSFPDDAAALEQWLEATRAPPRGRRGHVARRCAARASARSRIGGAPSEACRRRARRCVLGAGHAATWRRC